MTIPRPTVASIVLAFFDTRRSASKVAHLFSTERRKIHAADVQRIWDAARADGRLPNLSRKRAAEHRR